MPGRQFNANSYKYGFNGKEKDDEIKGAGNSLDFGARIYDSRLRRWLAVDPLQSKYPNQSPYNYCSNDPIVFIDPDGMEVIWHSSLRKIKGFDVIINAVTETDAFKTVYNRFLQNQSNVVITQDNMGGAEDYAYASPFKKPFGYEIDINSYYFSSGKLGMDATFLYVNILHEGMHQKYELAKKDGLQNYPGFKGGQTEHSVMTANIDLFVTGMKDFDGKMGTSHSDDWYTAMAWRGSMQGTNAYNNLSKGTKDNYENIIKNEIKYELYLSAQAKYEKRGTEKNKQKMEKALDAVDMKLRQEINK